MEREEYTKLVFQGEPPDDDETLSVETAIQWGHIYESPKGLRCTSCAAYITDTTLGDKHCPTLSCTGFNGVFTK